MGYRYGFTPRHAYVFDTIMTCLSGHHAHWGAKSLREVRVDWELMVIWGVEKRSTTRRELAEITGEKAAFLSRVIGGYRKAGTVTERRSTADARMSYLEAGPGVLSMFETYQAALEYWERLGGGWSDPGWWAVTVRDFLRGAVADSRNNPRYTIRQLLIDVTVGSYDVLEGRAADIGEIAQVVGVSRKVIADATTSMVWSRSIEAEPHPTDGRKTMFRYVATDEQRQSWVTFFEARARETGVTDQYQSPGVMLAHELAQEPGGERA